MTGTAIALVLAAAFAHATWNFLVRRSEYPEITNWLMATAGGVIAFPFAIYLAFQSFPGLTGWVFIAGTVALHIVYFFTLGRAYKHGDLSIVYPLARGLGLALIPVFGTLILRETVSAVGSLGIVAIFIGVIVVGSSSGQGLKVWLEPRKLVADKGVVFALITGLIIASYSNWDKRGVEYVEPLLYMFTVQLGGALGSLPILLRSYVIADFAGVMKTTWRPVVIGGIAQFASYGLVLTAFTLAPVSYVGPFRELAIVFGVLFALFILKEDVGRQRIAGATAIGAGAILVALAP